MLFAVYMYWQRKTMRWQLFIICIVLISGRYVLFQLNQNVKVIHDTVQIVDIDYYESSERLTIRYHNHRYHLYVYSDDYALGDWINVQGNIQPYETVTIPGGFNAKSYYLSHHVLGKVIVNELSFEHAGFNLLQLRAWLMDHVSTSHQSFVKSFIFGKDQLDDTTSDMFKQANLLFLMQTTGLHAYALVILFRKMMFYFNTDEHVQDGVTIGIYSVLCYLNGFTIGVVRLCLTQIFRVINKHYQLRLTPLDRLFIVCFMMILLNFSWVYSVGLFMTFMILLVIEIARDRYQSYHGYLKRLVISLLITLACLPFTGFFNPLIICCLPMIIFYVTGIIYPLTFMACFTTRIDHVLGYLFEGLKWSVEMLNHAGLTLYMPAFNTWQICLYYGFLAYMLRAYQTKQLWLRTVLLSGLFGFKIISNQYVNDAAVYILDVGQGDTIYVETRTCKAMIDSFNGSAAFLKDHGVYQLDYLFLTHSDEDHTKEADLIINDIGVNHVIVNPYDNQYDAYTAQIIKGYAHQHIMCGQLDFYILGPLKAYANANDNSLVLAVTIGEDDYLFTGDISQTVEHDLVDAYDNDLKSDILKVAHHGSNTSSADRFIKAVQPRDAVISVGRSNRFGFPHQETLDTLYKYGVHITRTDQIGTIQITYKRTERLWEGMLPISDEF